MPERLAKRLFDFQCKKGMLDESKRRLYEYAYGMLISRIFVYIIIALVGILLGNLKEMVVFLFAFIPLRQYAGGIHMEKAERCIVASGVLVCAAGQYIHYYPIVTRPILLVWIAAVCIIFKLSPVGCRNKKLDLIEQKVYRKRSRIILGTECMLTVFVLFMSYGWIFKGVILAQIVLSVSLVLGWIKENFF